MGRGKLIVIILIIIFLVFTSTVFSGLNVDNVLLLIMTSKEIASPWRLEDNFLVHVLSGEMLTAFKDGSMYLAPKTADLRSLDHADLSSAVMDRSFGIVEKLLGVFDFVKVSAIFKREMGIKIFLSAGLEV